MKTIICGAGEVGYSIADKLSKENFEVTVIDESKSRLSKVSEHLDVKTISKAVIAATNSELYFKSIFTSFNNND